MGKIFQNYLIPIWEDFFLPDLPYDNLDELFFIKLDDKSLGNKRLFIELEFYSVFQTYSSSLSLI